MKYKYHKKDWQMPDGSINYRIKYWYDLERSAWAKQVKENIENAMFEYLIRHDKDEDDGR